jgi:hypothetical protein
LVIGLGVVGRTPFPGASCYPTTAGRDRAGVRSVSRVKSECAIRQQKRKIKMKTRIRKRIKSRMRIKRRKKQEGEHGRLQSSSYSSSCS